MFSRTFLFLGILSAAFVLPILMSDERWSQAFQKPIGWLNAARQSAEGSLAGGAAPDGSPPANTPPAESFWGVSDTPAAPPAPPSDPGASYGNSPNAPAWPTQLVARKVEWPPVGGPPVNSIADVVRFDATPQWLVQNWARVATLPAEDRWPQVFRVPLTTGGQLHDIWGSLTYYFDAQSTPQRVKLHGRTGDANPLLGVAQQQWQLKPDPSLGPGTYVFRHEQQVLGILRVVLPQVIRSDAPQERYEIFLELNRLGSPLSSEAAGVAGPQPTAPASAQLSG